MAKIPYAEPDAPRLTGESIAPRINPAAAGEGARAVSEAANRVAAVTAEYGRRMQQLEQAQAITKGSLALEDSMDSAYQAAVESNDYQKGPQDFNAAAAKLGDQINSQYDGIVRETLQNRLEAKRILQSHQLAAWAHNGTMAAARQTLSDALDQGAKDYAYASGKDRSRILQQQMADIQAHVGTVYTPAQADKVSQAFKANADNQAAAADITADPQAALAGLQDHSQYTGLEPDQRSAYIARAQAEIRRRSALHDNLLHGQMADAVDAAHVTGKTNAQTMAKAKSELPPDDYQDFAKQINVALTFHAATQELSHGTPEERQAILEKYKPNADQDHFRERQQFWSALSKQNDKINTTLLTDPASLVTPIHAPFWQQIEHNIAAEKALGAPSPKPISNQQAKGIVEQFNATDPAARPAFLKSLEGEAGSAHFPAVMRQLLAHKLPPEAMLMPKVDTQTALALSNLTSIKLQKLKDLVGPTAKGVLDTADTQFAKLAATLPPGPAQTSAVKQVYDKYTLMLAANGDSDPAQTAYQHLFGQYEVQGNWRFPAGTPDTGKIKAYAAHVIQSSDLLTQVPALEHLQKAQLMSQGRWVLSADDATYHLYMGAQLVRKADGHPLSFTIPQAQLSDVQPTLTPAEEANILRAH